MRHPTLIQTLLLVLTLLGAGTAHATPPGAIRFRTLQTADGLSSNDVNCIFKDSHGFVWIGTASGLDRYDGYSIRIFHSQHPDSTALRDNYVQHIEEDARGNLWIQAGNSYSIFDPRTERFVWLDGREARRRGLPGEPTLATVDGDDIWYTVDNRRLFRQKGNGRPQEIMIPALRADISDVRIFPGGRQVAIADRLGNVTIVDANTGKTRLRASSPREMPGGEDFYLFVDNEGLIWVFSVAGVDILDPATGRWGAAPVTEAIRDVAVKTITQDNDGNIWIGTDNHGIAILHKDGTSETLLNNPLDAYSLPNNTVKYLYNSGDSGMWAGTYKKGVSIYYPSENKFVSRLLADVNCISRATDGYATVWLGTDNEGLLRYNYETGAMEKVADPAERDPRAITALASDPEGNLWIGTYQGGLKRYSHGTFSHWTTGNGLASDNIWGILPGRDGRLWLATLGGGLQLFDPAGGTFRTFNKSNSNLNTDHVTSLARSRDGSLYVGTTYGIERVNPTDYSITGLNGKDKTGRGLSNLNVTQLATDSRGLLWVGTREGLEVYDAKADTIYDISLSERFPNPFILGVTEGADHTMWVAVGNELFNIRTEQTRPDSSLSFTVSTFGSHDGILSGAFNQRSMCLLPSGEMLAGTLDGIVGINPDGMPLNTAPPRIMLTGLAIKNVPVEAGDTCGGRRVLAEAIDYASEIRLNHDQNDITIGFATDNYSNTTRTLYRYRLTGLDDEWLQCQPGTHHATFTNLVPGTYTLEIEAVNSDGVVCAAPRTLKIIVEAPWWSTWWARLIYVLAASGAVIAIVYMLHRRSITRLHRRQKEELAKKTEELNQLKFKFFTNISHDLRTPLTLILSPVDSMLRETNDERDRRRLTTVKANASRLLYLVNQLLDFRKNEMAGLKLHLSEGNLAESIRQSLATFADLTDLRGITLDTDLQDSHMQMSYDNDKFTKMLVNLLSNAVKYTPDGGHITVGMRRDGEWVKVSVADTGKGIPDADKRRIFERFYRGSDESDLNTGSGIGLSLVYEYARLHGGSVEVADNHPRGTVFTITLPYREADGSHAYRAATPAPVPDRQPDTARDDTKPAGTAKPKVLVVDDNRDLIEFIKDEFGGVYDITTAANGVEALQRVKEKAFDLIVTDLMMPEMDGIELTRRLKSDSATVDIPLLMLTARQDPGSMVEGLTLGADDYITKPFNNEVLALKLNRLAGLKKSGFRRSLIDPTPSRVEITPLDEQLVAKAVKYVEDNISRSDLSVEELAANMGMSRVHLYKKLSALTGKSPVEFIRLLRLKRACQYLRESQLNIAEIAYRLGFNNPKYFSRYFKEEFGMLPSEYQGKWARQQNDHKTETFKTDG